MFSNRRSTKERWTSGALTLGVVAALGYALVAGLTVEMPDALADSLKVFGVAPEPPPPPVEHVRATPSERPIRSGKASAPNVRSKATEVTAPVPIVPPLAPPPPITVAPQPGVGMQASTGAAPLPGPGAGAGGIGNGTGSGGYGDGEGEGNDGDYSPPRLRRGRLHMSDNPDPLTIGGRVSVRYAVEPDGRVDRCEITHSSGFPILDQTTCRLIEQRFRYEPSRDEEGRPVRSYIVESHSWEIEDEPGER